MENEQWPSNYQQSVTNNSENPINHHNSPNNGDTKISTTKVETHNSYMNDESDVKVFLPYTKQEDDTNIIISEKSRETIQLILKQIKCLSQNEKYFLYLKLPTEITDMVDPFRQSINPLGSRSEIARTIVWIQTHLEEDQNISLPKKEVYGEYEQYCTRNSIKPLSQADFGKVMKQVFPMVRARRLGQRGNSKYCYSGLRRRVNLKCPLLPDLADKPLLTESASCFSTLTFAAWLIVKDWAQKQLNTHFPTLHSLAHYLVRHCSIDAETEAVNKITSSIEPLIKIEEPTTPTPIPATSKNCSKHTQIQLQKKLLQRNEGKERKRKMQNKSETKPGVKKYRSHSVPATSVLSNDTIGISTKNKITNITNGECNTTSSSCSSSNSVSPTQGRTICDKSEFFQLNTHALPDFKSFQKLVLCDSGLSVTGEDNTNKTIPVITNDKMILRIHPTNPQCSVLNQANIQRKQYKAIQPKLQLCDIPMYNNTSAQVVTPHKDTTVLIKKRSHQTDCVPVEADDEKAIKDKVSNSKCEIILNKCEVDDDFPLTRERLDSVSNVEKNAMDEYLGTNNSQHEEELSKYFHSNDNTSLAAHNENKNKLSTLRQLLEQNGISEKKTDGSSSLSEHLSSYTNSNSTISSISPQDPTSINTLQTLPIITNIVNNLRRRVSFDTHVPDECVPPSPNTRSKHFSFTPISPGSHSPNSGQSKCSSTSASPFVSPSNTPVPRIKTANHQNSTLIVSQESRKPTTKIKNELELNLEISGDINKNTSLSSTPISPMHNNNNNNNNIDSKSMLQKLLNTTNKIEYRPEYTLASKRDSTHLFTNQRLNEVQNGFIAINSSSDNIISEILKRDPEFSEIPVQENNSKQFFNQIDNHASCDNNNINTLNVDISSNNHCLPEFGMHLINNSSESSCIPDYPFADNVQKFRNLTRSHSIDVEATLNVSKFAPSRSVPTTPLSFFHNLELDSVERKNFLNSSRSYPSTPLTTNETFVYQLNPDCIMNGQPVCSAVDNIEFLPNLTMATDNVTQQKAFPLNNEFGIMESTDSFMDENGILIQQGFNTDNTNN